MSAKKVTGIDKLSYARKSSFVLDSMKCTAKRLVVRSKAIKPRHLVNIVTWQCNGRCEMCNISRLQDSKKMISLKEYDEILSDRPFWSSLRSMNVTGGEPFLRKDLTELIMLFRDRCRNLRKIDISTNGFMTKKIVSFVNDVVPELGLDVGISVSLDGVGPVHDKIRGVKGAFRKTKATIDAIKKLEKSHGNLMLTTQCVVSSLNFDNIEELGRFCQERGIPSSLSIASFQDPYYKNMDKQHLGLTKEQIKKLYSRNHFIDYYVRKQVELNRRFLPCDAGFGTFSINPYADVYFCNNLPKIGNLRKKTIREIWYSKKAEEARKAIRKGEICRQCFYSCDLASAIRKSFPLTLKFGTTHYMLKRGLMKVH